MKFSGRSRKRKSNHGGEVVCTDRLYIQGADAIDKHHALTLARIDDIPPSDSRRDDLIEAASDLVTLQGIHTLAATSIHLYAQSGNLPEGDERKRVESEEYRFRGNLGEATLRLGAKASELQMNLLPAQIQTIIHQEAAYATYEHPADNAA